MVYLYDEAVSMQEYLFGNPKDDIGRELIFDLPVRILRVCTYTSKLPAHVYP